MHKHILAWFFIIFLPIHWPTQAHTQDTFFETPSTTTQNRHGQLFVGINTWSFLKNNEYFNPIIQGHTLAGYQIHPYLSYYPANNIQVDLGVFTRKDWADTHFLSKATPTFTIKYQEQAFSFLLGNIAGGTAHQLINPLYDLESMLLRGVATGLQLQYLQPNTFVDIWLDWLSLLCKQTGKPEEFCAGIALDQTLRQNQWVCWGLPIQGMVYHLGGQGIATKAYSLFVGAIGASLKVKISEHAWLRNMLFENYYLANSYSKEGLRPFRVGHAFYSNLTLETAWLMLTGSYWQGHGFSSEGMGNPLYQSMALLNKQVKHQEKFRQLFLLHVGYSYQLAASMSLVLHLDPYYDAQNNLLEHAAGIYIIYKPFFSIGKIKPLDCLPSN